MLVLAIDTTTRRGSAAVVEGSELRGEVRLSSEGSHSSRLLPGVAFLLDSLALAPERIEAYAVAVGPGSFTGLRIGISTVQGLALANPRPCLGVSALDCLAARIRGRAPRLVAWMDAWRDEVYGAVYDAEGRLLDGPVVEAPNAFLDRLQSGPTAFLGDGAIRYRELIASRLEGACFPERSLFLAGTVGLLAAPRLAAGEGRGPEALRPLYVRPADAAGARG